MKFSVAVANPPWNIKENGKVIKQNLWREFADLLLSVAETVVVVAPMAARQTGKRVLIDRIAFEGNDGEGCAVVWSESAARDFSGFPKFDLRFESFLGAACATAKRCGPNNTIPVKTWSGVEQLAAPSTLKRCGFGTEKGIFRFQLNKPHDAIFTKDLLSECLVAFGAEEEFNRFIGWLNSAEGRATCLSLSNNHQRGFGKIKIGDINAAFSLHHK